MTVQTHRGPLRITTSNLRSRTGEVLGHSDRHVIEQADANAFGAATRDEQWIHTDALRAAQGPFGRTIAHGYLTLSLATSLVDEVVVVSDAVMVVNYGVDRVRFPAPLPLSAEVRAEVTLSGLRDFPGGVQVTLHLVYEGAGQLKACCVADVPLRYYTAPEPLEQPRTSSLPIFRVSRSTIHWRFCHVRSEVTAMLLYCLRVSRLEEQAKLTDTIAALAKMNNTLKARQVIADARDLLGGNGILLENHVIRHMTDIESIYTYEGTEHIQTLIVGRDITGVSAFA